MTVPAPRGEDGRGIGPGRLSLRPLRPGRVGERPADPKRVDPALRSLIDALLEVMRRGGYPSLSAPLLGVSRRVIAIDLARTGQSQVVLVDPVLEAVSVERQVDREGCPGLPGVMGNVERPLRVVVSGRTPDGQHVRLHAAGLLARLLQHELDHLEGRSFLDRVRGPERARLEAALAAVSPRCDRDPVAPGSEVEPTSPRAPDRTR